MPNYGVLSKRKQEDQQAGARVEVASYKKHHADFVLWKPSKQGEPSWQTPWQSDIASAGHISGRPGWHIECSAMNHAIFGETIDIHGGGSDLVFPHHENECAQSMCAFDNDVYAKYWLHNAFVTINGEKMSKSLANFITVHELLEKHNISGEVIRYVLLSAHYRQPVDWNDNNIQQAQNNLDYLYNCLHNMADKTVTPDLNSLDIEPLLDDLNTPLALQKLQSYANSLNKNYDSVLHGKMLGLANSMGLLYQQPKSWFQGNATDTQVIEQLIAQRQQARAGRDFIKADAIRKSLLQDHNVLLDDQPSGTTWKYNNEQ
jgi:cysteinyl-tRNA synthetase